MSGFYQEFVPLFADPGRNEDGSRKNRKCVPLNIDSQKLKIPNSADYAAQKATYVKRLGGKKLLQ